MENNSAIVVFNFSFMLLGSLVKTESGYSELKSRSSALSLQERRVLILLNGSRLLSSLQKMVDFEVHAAVHRLMMLGLIGFVHIPVGSATGSPVPVAPAPERVPSTSANGPAARGKLYLLGVTTHMLGSEDSELCTQIATAHTVPELRQAMRAFTGQLAGLVADKTLRGIERNFEGEVSG